MIRCAKCGSKIGVTGPCKTCKRNAANAYTKTRPSIAELEKILEEKGLEAIEILPSGEIRAAGVMQYQELVRRLGARLTELLDADHWNNIEPLLHEIGRASLPTEDTALLDWLEAHVGWTHTLGAPLDATMCIQFVLPNEEASLRDCLRSAMKATSEAAKRFYRKDSRKVTESVTPVSEEG